MTGDFCWPQRRRGARTVREQPSVFAETENRQTSRLILEHHYSRTHNLRRGSPDTPQDGHTRLRVNDWEDEKQATPESCAARHAPNARPTLDGRPQTTNIAPQVCVLANSPMPKPTSVHQCLRTTDTWRPQRCANSVWCDGPQGSTRARKQPAIAPTLRREYSLRQLGSTRQCRRNCLKFCHL